MPPSNCQHPALPSILSLTDAFLSCLRPMAGSSRKIPMIFRVVFWLVLWKYAKDPGVRNYRSGLFRKARRWNDDHGWIVVGLFHTVRGWLCRADCGDGFSMTRGIGITFQRFRRVRESAAHTFLDGRSDNSVSCVSLYLILGCSMFDVGNLFFQLEPGISGIEHSTRKPKLNSCNGERKPRITRITRIFWFGFSHHLQLRRSCK